MAALARSTSPCRCAPVIRPSPWTCADALRCVDELRPDVTLVDIDLGGESGFDLARELLVSAGFTPVILISTHAEDDYATLIAASPAIGFVSKAALSARSVRDLLAGGRGTSDARIDRSGGR